MIPQITIAIWLTIVHLNLVRILGTKNAEDTFTSFIASLMWVAIPIVALWYAGFWIVN